MAIRPPYFNPDGTFPTEQWRGQYGFVVQAPGSGKIVHQYVPSPKQLDFHEAYVPNCIIEGSRGTGKSLCIRNDAHMRALAVPGFTYLVVRRTMPELKKSHLRFIGSEMRAFWGGKDGGWHKTDNVATYPNGSQGFFSHCETEDDMMKLLSSEFDAIYFDEISTFTWTMISKIGSCLRVPEDSGRIAILRGGTNPIGVGAAEVKRYYITKDVTAEEDSSYDPADYQAIHTTLEDNPHIDREQYIKRLSNLPEHIRRAWLDGEWIVEGAYFHDYKPSIGGKPWHVTDEYPRVKAAPADQVKWIQIYRALDWGFSPDPAVCLWIASLPNGRAFVLKEKTWKSTTARKVAEDIVAESAGMRVIETYCDPSMFFNSQATDNTSIGDIFEANGVPLSPSQNDRAAAGFAIHEYLNTILEDGLPKLQIYSFGCPMLLRTIPEMRVHKNDPRKIADGNDHYCISLAYYCMGRIGTSREPSKALQPAWMKKKPTTQARLGQESVRSSGRV